jgi:thiol-disulfide isomerase/thioredoxin
VKLRQVIRVCDLFDRPLVISFWFTRGGDCETQQDVVSSVAERYRGRVNFLSLNIRDERDQVRTLIRERGWSMPVGHDRDGAVSNIYRVGGCPTFVFAYPGGILERATIGELGAAALARSVDRLLTASRRRAAVPG